MVDAASFANIESFVARIDEATHLDQVRAILSQEVARLEFERFTYWLLWPPEGPRISLYLTNYPLEWTQHYIASDYKSHDIVANHSASSLRPFLWETLQAQYMLSDIQNAVFDDARAFGLKVGGSIPIHGPKNANACFSVANCCPAKEFRSLFDMARHELQLIATYTHEKVIQLGLQKPATSINLTARELEVLTWTAQGKTRWEIGEILHISEDTVKKHLLGASTRLGVSSKAHAVAKALQHRIIIP